MAEGMYSVISALIGAAATILAAAIAVISARRIVKKDIQPFFYSYSDKNHDVRALLKRAHKNIVVVASMGDVFLKRYSGIIEKKLRAGVSVYYLLLSEECSLKMDTYIHGLPNRLPIVQEHRGGVMDKLKELHKVDLDQCRDSGEPQRLRVREFEGFLTASYIGVDIPIFPWTLQPPISTSVIQIMQYQYHVKTENSPIAYCFPGRDKKQYDSTVHSINELWDDAKEVLFTSEIYSNC